VQHHPLRSVIVAGIVGIAVVMVASACSGGDETARPPADAAAATSTTTTSTTTTSTSSTTSTTTTTTSTTTTVPSGGGGGDESGEDGDSGPVGLPWYPDCDAAHAAGVTPIASDEPGYRPGLDRDLDGIACETDPGDGEGNEGRSGSSLSFFSSPSGNIVCDLTGEWVRCDIRERTWSPPPAPQWCLEEGSDWGQGVELAPGQAARWVCATDTAFGGSPSVLDYGQWAQRGNLRCDSAPSGMTCKDLGSGRGFTLSKSAARLT
jgi:hypothetical protein